MEKYYAFAGLELTVSTRDEWMYEDDRMLAPFRVAFVSNPHLFTFSIVDKLTPPTGDFDAMMESILAYRDGNTRIRYYGASSDDWHTAFIRIEHQGKTHSVEVRSTAYRQCISPKTVLKAIDIEHLIAKQNSFVFHASFIDIGGKAILFTAPSGTGKSTQAELWHSLRNACILNGDRSIVRCTEDGIFACGIPFMGSSEYCENVTLPLAAIVYLSQAPQTTIRPLKGLEAFRHVWEGVSINIWEKDDVSRTMDTVGHVIQSVPIYHLACTPDETAVAALEQQLGK